MLSPDLHDKVSDFLNHRVSVDELIRWLRPRELSMVVDPDSPDSELIAAIELAHAELHDGLGDETAFRSSVRDEWQRALCAQADTDTCTLSSSSVVAYSVVEVDFTWAPASGRQSLGLVTVQSWSSP